MGSGALLSQKVNITIFSAEVSRPRWPLTQYFSRDDLHQAFALWSDRIRDQLSWSHALPRIESPVAALWIERRQHSTIIQYHGYTSLNGCFPCAARIFSIIPWSPFSDLLFRLHLQLTDSLSAKTKPKMDIVFVAKVDGLQNVLTVCSTHGDMNVADIQFRQIDAHQLFPFISGQTVDGQLRNAVFYQKFKSIW